MPSKSTAQHRLMMAAAHTPSGYGGVPQSVGMEFARADTKRGLFKAPYRSIAPNKKRRGKRKGKK